MMKNLLTNLPEDVFINNILLSNSKVLPIKSLLSLRCVCKYLRNLITSPAFINIQISKENNNTLVLLKATHRPDAFFSLKFNGDHDPEYVELVSPIERSRICGSCNGLICLAKRNNVCLWNPFTKEYKVLPPPLPLTEIPIRNIRIRSITYGFGYDHLLGDYKIIRCSEHTVVRSGSGDDDDLIPIIEFQVYTLRTNAWRKISIDNNPYKFYFVLSLESVVFVNGALHWIMSTSDWLMGKSLGRTEAKIVSFDIEKEVFQEIQTPLMAQFKKDFSFCPVIRVLRGCLCVLECDSSTGNFCNVWMMMDYGVKESWTKLFTILRSSYCFMSPKSYKLLRFCENGTEILMGSYDVMLVYDTINNKSRCIEFGENFDMFSKCLMYESEIYIESLVSLNSGVYKGKGGWKASDSTTRCVYKGERGWKGSDSTARSLGDMAWRYMQKENYYMAEQLYSKALSIEPDKNKQCNLAICLMNNGRIPEAKSLLQAVVNPSSVKQGIPHSYIKSYNRAWKILAELESQSAVLN